uniref:Uncharacterized protein n=1 Tax=Strongyloides stercoralis TaxID=6248 RepID=A0A0K0E3F4_STRER
MEFTKCPEMPEITASAYKRFTSYDDNRKVEKLKEYVEAYFSLVEDESCISTPDGNQDCAFEKFSDRKNKAQTKIFLLSKFIENSELKEVIFSFDEDHEKCFNLYKDVVRFKGKFELLENVKLTDFQNAYNFVFLKLKNHYYEKKRTNFSIYEKVKEFIEEYTSENKLNNTGINLFGEEPKELLLVKINEKIISILNQQQPRNVLVADNECTTIEASEITPPKKRGQKRKTTEEKKKTKKRRIVQQMYLSQVTTDWCFQDISEILEN